MNAHAKFEHDGLSKKFGAYTAAMLSLDETATDCHITGPQGESGSLALADNTGHLTSRDNKYDVPIPEAVVERITAWAVQHGY